VRLGGVEGGCLVHLMKVVWTTTKVRKKGAVAMPWLPRATNRVHYRIPQRAVGVTA